MIAVVHLVWGPLGPESLREFLRSYNEHEAGAPHELVMLFNGIPSHGEDAALREAYLAELAGIPHRRIDIERPVLDLVAYERAAAVLDHEYMCMFNSHSRLRAAGWLAVLEEALRQPKIGLVGATGSWASMRSYALRRLRLPSAYRQVWPDRDRTFREFEQLELARGGAAAPGGLLARLHTARALSDMTVGFSRFPAPHIRTNAFMAERQLLRGALRGSLRRKVNAHRLESGRQSITVQVQQAGSRALVVDKNGHAFESAQWPESETFWQGDQRGLLVADNQTETYQSADLARRRLLAQYAWGAHAAPSALSA